MFNQDDFTAFIRYANRERSLDASTRAAQKYGRPQDLTPVAALREINKRMLFRETTRNAPPKD